MSTTAFKVTGLTCEHCANAVTEELGNLDGVSGVQVDLVAGGTSTVTVTSATVLNEQEVAAALDEAGDYRLA
jgi:copper chaperone CopZ